MESKAFYIKRLLSTLGMCVLGLVIAAVVFGENSPFEGSVFLSTAAFAGMPFGWMALRRVFGGIFFCGLFGTLLYFVCMLALSIVVGWAILCYRLVRDTVQLIIAWRAEKTAATMPW